MRHRHEGHGHSSEAGKVHHIDQRDGGPKLDIEGAFEMVVVRALTHGADADRGAAFAFEERRDADGDVGGSGIVRSSA